MGPVSKASKVLGAFAVLFPDDGVKGIAKTCHCGVEVQGKCPVKCSAKMSLG